MICIKTFMVILHTHTLKVPPYSFLIMPVLFPLSITKVKVFLLSHVQCLLKRRLDILQKHKNQRNLSINSLSLPVRGDYGSPLRSDSKQIIFNLNGKMEKASFACLRTVLYLQLLSRIFFLVHYHVCRPVFLIRESIKNSHFHSENI